MLYFKVVKIEIDSMRAVFPEDRDIAIDNLW